MKIFNIAFGILSIIVAFVCIAHPFATQLTYGYIAAIFMGVMGIGCIINYFINRKAIKANAIDAAAGTANLAVGIFGVVFMLLNMTVPFFTYSVQEFGAILVALFMLIEGAKCVGEAVANKSGASAMARIMTGVLGVLMIIGFLGALAFPALIISMFGMFMGVGLLVQGVSRLAAGFML